MDVETLQVGPVTTSGDATNTNAEADFGNAAAVPAVAGMFLRRQVAFCRRSAYRASNAAEGAGVVIDMSAWKTKRVDVLVDIDLDPLNVRLDVVAGAPEADVLRDLFRNEKALKLVESIVKVGYLTHELPVVVKRDDRLVVVEGNRRVAALKAIHNPYLVPEFQTRIAATTEGFGGRDDLMKIDVKIAPSQEEADQLVATLHAGSPRVAWTPPRQAAFFQAQLEAGRTYAQLRADYPTIDIDKFVLRAVIIERFRAVRYPHAELAAFVTSRSMSASTLARVYQSKDFIDLAGLKLGANGQLITTLPKRTFDAIATVIAQGMFDGNIDTRSIGTTSSPRFKALMSELRELVQPSSPAPEPHAPPPDSSGATASATSRPNGQSSAGQPSGTNEPASPASPEPAPAPSARPSQTKKAFLDVSGLVAPAGFPPAINRILQEFSTLNIDKYPNAAIDLLRTLLEKTTKAYAEANGLTIKKPGAGYVYLSDCLKWLEHRFASAGPKSLVQVAKQMQSLQARDYLGSQDHLNAINHNHKIFADGNDVRHTYDTMHGLLAEMLK